MTYWEFLFWFCVFFWFFLAGCQWGWSMGMQWQSGELMRLFKPKGEFERAIMRGMLLSLIAWPYLTYRDMVKEFKVMEEEHEKDH